MVAYTPEFCLPFFEGTDSPCLNLGTVCEPQNLWCNFANLVEAQLSAVDSIMARTTDAIPIASISFLPEDGTFINGTVPFDTVNLDTDNMVDLPVFTGITPVRNGIYGITARVSVAPLITNDFPDMRIHIGNEVAPQQGGTLALGPASSTTRGFGTLQWVFASIHYKFDDLSPSPRNVSLVYDTAATEEIFEAHLDVFWHSELD